jgi:hypothetical protein
MKADTFDSRRLRSLHQDWPSEACAQFSLLSSENTLQVPSCQRTQNQLGLGTALLAAIVAHGCILPLATSAYPLKTLLTNESRNRVGIKHTP